MKKIKSIIACLSLIPMLVFPTCAADINTYYIEECALSVDIPTSFSVFTRDMDENDPSLSNFGISWSELSSIFNERSIYLDAMDEDHSTEIYITMTESSFPDFNQLSDTQLRVFASSLQSQFAEIDITIEDYDIYNHNGVKYIKLAESKDSELGLQYYTTYGGKAINITLASFTGTISSGQKAIVKGVVDSAVFDADPVPTPEMEATEEFVYKDDEGSVEFVVPANWTKENLSKERKTIDVKFMSNEEAGMAILYGSSDAWNDWMTDEEKAGLTRSEMDNSAFDPSDIAMLLDIEPSEVTTKVFGGKEYFYIVTRKTASSYGLNMDVEMITALRFYDGYYYQFQFSGNEDNKCYKDFVSLLESVKYTNEEDNLIGSDTIGDDGSNGAAIKTQKDRTSVIIAVLIVVLGGFVAMLFIRNSKKKNARESRKTEPKPGDEQSWSYEEHDMETITKTPDNSVTSDMGKEHEWRSQKQAQEKLVCPNCKQVLEDDSNFCPYCGTQVMIFCED